MIFPVPVDAKYMTLGRSLWVTLLNDLDKLLPVVNDQRLDPQPWRIDRALARVYQDVVQEASERTADKGADHGDLCSISMCRGCCGLLGEGYTQK